MSSRSHPSAPARMPRRIATAPRQSADDDAQGLMPQSVEAEAAVLGGLLIAGIAGDLETVGRVLSRLRADDFYREAHRTIFQTMLDLHAAQMPIDLLLVTEELRRRGVLEQVGGTSAVSALTNDASVPSSLHVEHYARIVVSEAVRRRLIVFGSQIAKDAYDNPHTAATLETAARMMAHAAEDANRERTAPADSGYIRADVLLNKEMPEPRWIVPGILPEGLTLLVGKPKMGKSWWALDVALSVALGGVALGQMPVDGADVLYLALEDNERRIKKRLRQVLDGTSPAHGATTQPESLTIFTNKKDDTWPALDQGGLARLEGDLIANPRIRLVFVDTLAKVRPRGQPNASVYAEDYAALVGLKELADRFGVAIVAIHHLRKMSAAGGDPLDEVSGSTGLTGAADSILVLRRERGKSEAELAITGRDVDEQNLAMAFDAARGTWSILGDADQMALSRERTELCDVLRDALPSALSIGEIAARLTRKYEQAKLLLWRAERDGDVYKTERGRYTLRDTTSSSLPSSLAPKIPISETLRNFETLKLSPDATHEGSPGNHGADDPLPYRNGHTDPNAKVSKFQSFKVSSNTPFSASTPHDDQSPAAMGISPPTAEAPPVRPYDDVCRFLSHEEYWRWTGDEWICPVCPRASPPLAAASESPPTTSAASNGHYPPTTNDDNDEESE